MTENRALPENWHNHDGYRAIFNAALTGICANPAFFGAIYQGSPAGAVKFASDVLAAALTFTASLSGGEGEGEARPEPARERRGDPSPAQPADALRPGEPEDHLSQLSRIFGRKVTRFKVPGRVDGIQRMEVGFADGDSITTTGADVDSAWRALLAEAETATPDPSNTQAQKMGEG